PRGAERRDLRGRTGQDRVAVADQEGLELELAELDDGRLGRGRVLGELRVRARERPAGRAERIARDEDPRHRVEDGDVPDGVAGRADDVEIEDAVAVGQAG